MVHRYVDQEQRNGDHYVGRLSGFMKHPLSLPPEEAKLEFCKFEGQNNRGVHGVKSAELVVFLMASLL